MEKDSMTYLALDDDLRGRLLREVRQVVAESDSYDLSLSDDCKRLWVNRPKRGPRPKQAPAEQPSAPDVDVPREILYSPGHREKMRLLREAEGFVKGDDRDPWAPRSSGMQCRTCMWFFAERELVGMASPSKKFGRCRRHAPTLQGFPAVFGHDWCGDHKPDEAKA